MTTGEAGGDGEHGARRADRQLGELLQEVRVALPGVQVLFAFLLTLPFSARFDEATGLQRDVFFATLLATALATVLLMAPTAIHRLDFRRGDKRYIVDVAHRLVVAGLLVLSIAIAGAVMLVSDVMYAAPVAGAIAGLLLGLTAALWFGVPLLRRWRRRGVRPGRG
ncbi:MAG: DUF6328 family protein [Thermoleophilia bacterium]